MPEETFKLTLNFPISALEAFKLFVNTAVDSLLLEEGNIRHELTNPKLDAATVAAIGSYLERIVIPQQMIASELKRAVTEAAPEIVI